MKDIKKTQFMLEAATKKGHNVFIEIGIALIVFFMGSMSTSIFQVPGMMGYLLKNKPSQGANDGGTANPQSR